MGIAFKIAWRNLWRHKGKSLVIGIILLFGAVIMTVGNGMISGMEQGLSDNIVNLFTGDIVLISNEQEQNNVFFNADGEFFKVIKNYEATKKVLQQEETIGDFLPAATGPASFLSGSDICNILLLGVDINRYREVFPDSVKMIEGRLINEKEKGVMVSEEARKQINDFIDFWIAPKGEKLNPDNLTDDDRKKLKDLEIHRDLVLMGTGSSNSGTDIKVPVTGIFKYKSLNQIWGGYCLIDIESFREANNFITGADSQVKISTEKEKLLDNEQWDQYFSTEDLIESGNKVIKSFSVEDIQEQTQLKIKQSSIDAGSYNIILVKLKKGTSQTKALNKLNETFRKNGINVKAVSWKEAVGSIGNIVMTFKSSLDVFILIIFFVAAIIIMNTLSMAVLERVSEIGMMRAVGAQKGFLRTMFVYETGLLTCFFGGLGIVVGIIIIHLLRTANITTSDEFVQLIFGGDKLNPLYTTADFIQGIISMGIVSLLSVIYPLRVAGKITPLDAISKE